ncbi:MAG: hypothetical protein Kow0080_29390 [Candidatus Promineifilaceae bacterium]
MNDVNNKWLWLYRGTAVFLITFLFLIILIQQGVFDPKPIGQPIYTQAINSTLTAEAYSTNIQWLPVSLPKGAYTIMLTANWQEGDNFSAYGMVVGSDDAYTAVLVSPLGYTAVTQNQKQLLPFQPWPHIKTGHATNEIWLDVTGSQMRIRLNKELLWSGDVAPPDGNVGLVATAFAETAVFRFQHLAITHTNYKQLESGD